MANFGLQQYYTNAQQNRFQAEEAQKERDWRSSEAWKSFGRDLLGRLGQTGMNIGQAFAEDYTPTREQAREFGKTKMDWEKEDRDTAAARARAEAMAGNLGMLSPYGQEGRPSAVPGVQVPTVQSGATPSTPTGPPQSLVQEKMRNVGGMSVPPATGMSMLPPATEADKARKAQGAVQPAAAPQVVPPTSTPTPPAGAMRSLYTHVNPEFGSQEGFGRVLDAVTQGKGASQEDIAIAQAAIAKAAAAQRANQVMRDKMLLERDKAMAPYYTAALGQTQSGKAGGKYGASYTRPMYGLDQERLTREFGTGSMGEPLTPVTPPALGAGGAVSGGGPGVGARIYPQGIGGVVESGKGKMLTAEEAYGSVRAAAERMINSGDTAKQTEGARLLNALQSTTPGSPEFKALYSRHITGGSAVASGEARGQVMPSSRATDKANAAARQLDAKQQEAADKHDYRERRLQLLERNMAGRISPADQLAIRDLNNKIRMDTESVQTYDKEGNNVIRKVPGSKSAAAQEQLDAIIAKYAGGSPVPAPAPSAAQPTEGSIGTSRNGVPIVFRNGQWVARQ